MKDRNIAGKQHSSRIHQEPKKPKRADTTELSESERSYKASLSVLMASPFMFAIEHGDLKTVKALMDSGAVGLSVRDPEGNEPLHAAAGQKDPEVIQFLIKHGAYLETKNDNGQTPLHVACTNGHTEVARLFIDLGLDVCLKDRDADTVLHQTCFHGHPAPGFVRLLLKKGADVNAQNNSGRTPLHYACMRGHADIVRVLLEHHADVNIRDTIDETAFEKTLHLPPGDAREEIIDLFREYAPEQVMERYCETQVNKETSP